MTIVHNKAIFQVSSECDNIILYTTTQYTSLQYNVHQMGPVIWNLQNKTKLQNFPFNSRGANLHRARLIMEISAIFLSQEPEKRFCKVKCDGRAKNPNGETISVLLLAFQSIKTCLDAMRSAWKKEL